MRINVSGNPVPKGSSQSFAARRKSGEYTGKVGYRPDSPGYADWNNAVRTEAQRKLEAGERPLLGPVMADAVIRFERPRSHYRAGKFSQQLRDDAPAWPYEGAAAKDIDKLLRAIFDGLQAGGVIQNDKQITMLGAVLRVYCGPGETPGASVFLAPAPPRPPSFRLITPEIPEVGK